jgi:hypothetical protein
MIRGLTILALCGGVGLCILAGCRPAGAVLFQDPSGPVSLSEDRIPGVYRLNRPASPGVGHMYFVEYQGPSDGRVVRLISPEGELLAQRGLIGTGIDRGRILVPLPPGSSLSRVVIDPPPQEGLSVHAMGFVAATNGFAAAGGTPSAGPQVSSWRRDGSRWEIGLQNAGQPGPSAGEGDVSSIPSGRGAPAWRLELVLECRPAPAWARFRAAEALAAEALAAARDPEIPQGDTGELYSLYRGPERVSAVITVGDGREERRLLFQSLPGVRTLHLYPAVVPLVPRSVRIEPLGGSGVWVERLSVITADEAPGKDAAGSDAATPAANQRETAANQREAPLGGPLAPLPADPGIVLLYDPAHWRSPAYELFSWTRFPEVLIVDTADYGVQSRFFKRLAFFVEKRGYRGRLVTDAEIAGRHGFNAHDYRAEDLARFFRQAAEERFPLHPEEEQLRAILLANGILRRNNGEYAPGTGAVISISRSSGPLLRRHLLTHEAFHGVFFASEAYRESCIDLWDALDEQERAFWLLFFRWVGYDTEDPYLSANELQAYLFQQERPEVGPYFRGVIATRLLASYPDRQRDILEFLEVHGGAFERRFDSLERRLLGTVELEGARVIEMTELADR